MIFRYSLTFDLSSAHLGAPVEGLTIDPAGIQDEFKPGSSLLRNIPAHLPDLALGQRWAKGYYTQALHQKGKVGKKMLHRGSGLALSRDFLELDEINYLLHGSFCTGRVSADTAHHKLT